MNQTLEPELVEAYALAKVRDPVIYTVELRHPSLVTSLFFVKSLRPYEFTVDGVVREFLPLGFKFNMPSTDDGGLQELTLALDNVENRVSDFCEAALAYEADPVEIYLRPYRASDPTKCLMRPALRLFLLDVLINMTTVSGRAVPQNFLNITFPSEDYTRDRFPGLSNF